MEKIMEKIEIVKNNIEHTNLKIEQIAIDIANDKKDKIIGAKEALSIYKKIIKDYKFICDMYFLKGINILKLEDDVYLRLAYFFADLKNNKEDINDLKNPFIINDIIKNNEYKKVK